MLLGLTEPTAGHAEVCGLDPRFSPLGVKRQVGYLPDDVGFYDDLTARQNLRYTAQLNGLDRRDAERHIDELLAEVNLAHAADLKVRGYSRGMRQRLGLADALVKSPSMLILDEPTVNIDPEGVREIQELVRRLSTDLGVTVLLSSHLLHQVEQVCDRIGIFSNGHLVACGTIERLIAGIEDRWTLELATAHGADETLVSLLSQMPGVNSACLEGDMAVITADHDVREAVVRSLVDRGVVPVHLHRRGVDLDALYHHYFVPGATDVH
jgi:ABC-2 type transport system ATP-binding protein